MINIKKTIYCFFNRAVLLFLGLLGIAVTFFVAKGAFYSLISFLRILTGAIPNPSIFLIFNIIGLIVIKTIFVHILISCIIPISFRAIKNSLFSTKLF